VDVAEKELRNPGKWPGVKAACCAVADLTAWQFLL